MKTMRKFVVISLLTILTAACPERLHAEGMYRPDTGGYAYLYSSSSPNWAAAIPIAVVGIAGIIALTLRHGHHAHAHAHAQAAQAHAH